MNEVEQLWHNISDHPMPAEFGEHVRKTAISLGEAILVYCSPSRERSLALTNLEQTVMWAIASIARNQ